jgi:uncharacterized protein DUF3309
MNAAARTVLLLVLVILLLGLLPMWPYAGWGYYPSGGAGLVLLVVLILIVAGRI